MARVNNGISPPRAIPVEAPVPSRPRSLGVSIAGLGQYLPALQVTNDDMSQIVETSDAWIRERTGIESRHQAAPEEASSDLGYEAAIEALRHANEQIEDIDLIIVCTASPDTPLPATACWLQDRLGAPHAAAFDLAAGCSGFMYGVHVATGLIRSGMHRKVLVVGAECMSRIVDYSDRSSCVLFGDGAGAAVLADQGKYDLLYSHIGTDGASANLIQIPAGGSRRSLNGDRIDAKQDKVAMRGREVFRLAVRRMINEAEAALDALDLTADDLDWIIPHQANARIIEAVGKTLGVTDERLLCDVAKVGNTSAASIPLALSRLDHENRFHPGDIVMTIAFGAGLTWGSQVYRVAE